MVGDASCGDSEATEHIGRALMGGCHGGDEHHDEGSADHVPDSAQNTEEAHESHCKSQRCVRQPGNASIWRWKIPS